MLVKRLARRFANLISSQVTEELSKRLSSYFPNQLDGNIELVDKMNREVAGKRSHDSYDVFHMSFILAAFESAKYFNEKMYKSENMDSDLALLTRALSLRSVEGLNLEFGVASGRTINHLASETSDTVYGFDSFAGLPETWRSGFQQGVFVQAIPAVRENVQLEVGLFSDTIPKFLMDFPDATVSFLHIDCDLYSSTKTIFDLLEGRIVPGTIICFDEYFNYPGWQHHEFAAFQEFITRAGLSYRYDSFVSKHQQVCIIIEKK